ncbi:hypothetical protein BH11MYX2_BH11MYX2_06520 [soil metagenome]
MRRLEGRTTRGSLLAGSPTPLHGGRTNSRTVPARCGKAGPIINPVRHPWRSSARCGNGGPIIGPLREGRADPQNPAAEKAPIIRAEAPAVPSINSGGRVGRTSPGAAAGRSSTPVPRHSLEPIQTCICPDFGHPRRHASPGTRCGRNSPTEPRKSSPPVRIINPGAERHLRTGCRSSTRAGPARGSSTPVRGRRGRHCPRRGHSRYGATRSCPDFGQPRRNVPRGTRLPILRRILRTTGRATKGLVLLQTAREVLEIIEILLRALVLRLPVLLRAWIDLRRTVRTRVVLRLRIRVGSLRARPLLKVGTLLRA